MDPPRHTLSPIHTTFSGPTGTLARSQKQQQQQYQQTSRGSTAGAGNDRHSPHDHAYALSQSHAGGQSYGRNHAHPLDSHVDYPTSSSASAGPSRSPSAAYNLPPLHSITQSYPPFPPSPVGRRHSPASLPLPPPPPLPSTLPPLPAPSVSAPDSPGSVNGGGGGGAAETGTPSSASATKKRRRPAKSDVSATAESLGIRQTQRVPLSCRECSRRKIKCDKAVPCRPCIERGEEAICKREAVMVKGKIVANEPLRANATLESLAQENLEIRNRVDRLERLIGRQSPDRAIKNEEALEFKEHRLAGVMEEVALGIGENVRWKGVSLGPNPDSTAPSKDQWYHSVPFETCLSTIPNRVKSEALVQFFADELYWIDGVVHVPTFLRQHNTFWAKSDQGRVDDDNWLALYFAVLSLSGYFMEADHAQLNGFQVNELSRLAKVWFDCSIAILMRNNFMGAAAFVALQAVQVLRYPFHLSGNTGIHSSMFLVGVRHAMAMNLHLVGGGYGESQEEKLAREMARRVWWGCVEPDWHFLPYLRYGHLSPHQFTTAMPDLTDDLEPLSESYDPLHFRLAMYRSARVLYRLFGNLSPFEDPRYEAVLAASEDMDVVTARLPPELQMSGERQHTSSSIACVRRFVQMTLAHRMYLVHRAYYIKSFRDATYAPSHTACIQAATDIINLAERGLPAPFYRLWNTTVWLVAAGIILSLDLVQAADAKREVTDATARRATLGNLVELLYNSGDVNVGIASRGAALIVHLGRAEQEIIAGSRQGAKMTREDILELISRSEAMPTPISGPHAHDSDTSIGTGGIRSLSGGGGGGGGSATTGASAAGSSSRMQPPGSAHLPSKPFTPPASHRSGSMHSQSLPADSPTVYHNAAYPSGTPVQGSSSSMGGGGAGGPGGDPSGSSSGYGPGGGMHGAAPGMLNPGMQWGGMLDLGMGMGISPGLPAVGPVAGHVPGPGLGMGMGMGGVGMGGGMGMGGMSGSGMGMGMGPGYSGGNGSNHANMSMTPDMNGSTGGAMHMQGHGQGQQHQHQHPHQYPGMVPDGTYPVAGQMPMTGEWILPENNALMGFIDELFPPGR